MFLGCVCYAGVGQSAEACAGQFLLSMINNNDEWVYIEPRMTKATYRQDDDDKNEYDYDYLYIL